MENKRKIKIKKLILILILISILAIGLKMILNYENKIELCQLKDNGSSQMMGYIITTKNKKRKAEVFSRFRDQTSASFLPLVSLRFQRKLRGWRSLPSRRLSSSPER